MDYRFFIKDKVNNNSFISKEILKIKLLVNGSNKRYTTKEIQHI
tara:strand:- start:3936 stop:4067 length:132 start_codon:yes stop_codon:yes gene_type:complete